MKSILAIIEKEIRGYFVSPIAYVVLTCFMCIMGFFFFNHLSTFNQLLAMYQAFRQPEVLQQLNLNDQVMTPTLYNMTIVLIFMMPLLTMRLFSEEKKLKTDELLFTTPLTTFQIMMGKFLSSYLFFLFMLLLTFIYPAILFTFGNPEPGQVIAGYLGIMLMGTAFLAVGNFVSSLTENQIVSAVITLVTLLMLFIIGWTAQMTSPTLGAVLSYLSLVEHFTDFAKGLIEVKHVVYYLSFIGFGMFLTKRSLDSQRWR